MSTQKLFFSYSRSDSPFALKLAKDLREAGADIWIDQLDIPAGNHWDSAVEKALNTSSYVLVILTPASTASTNVMDEVSFALEAGKKVIPVLLEDCLAPFRLRRLQRIDFTTDYTAGFNQLVLSLNLTMSQEAKTHDAPGEPAPIPIAAHEVAAPPANKVDEKPELVLWEEACRVNTIDSYKKYLSETQKGEYKAEANLLIKQLELEQKEDEVEALLWQKAKKENTKKIYQQYLQEHPQGNYKTLALAAVAEFEKIEKEEQKRIQDLEKQQALEKAQREKEEKEKALREKQEKEKAQREKEEKEKQIAREKAQKEKEEADKIRQLEKEKAQREKEIAQREKEEKDKLREKEKQLEREKAQKEKEEKEKAKAAEQAKLRAERIARGEPADPPANSKKYVMIGGGALVLVLLIWGISKMGSGGGDAKAWKEALVKNDSTAYANYQQAFPTGKYFTQAKEKIDSLYWLQKAKTDSLKLVQTKTDSLNKVASPSKTNTAKKDVAVKTKPTTPTKPVAKLSIGQAHQGGIIISLNAKGDHGLIVSTKEVGNVDWEKAKKICSAYKVESYSGWHLPNKDELNLIFTNRKFLGNLAKGSYWSSNEEGKSAWSQNFNNGNQSKTNKQSNISVRAVRGF